MMGFDEYQTMVEEYDLSDSSKWKKKQDFRESAFIDKVLGLAGEAGEAVDKVKKVLRDKGGEASSEDRAEIIKELGDTLWYVATIARYLDVPLSEVAEKNVIKLGSRKARGKLGGAGDNR